MDTVKGLIFVAVTTLALSYGWGMRGTVIGGEKGAMLPGALLGIMFAWYTGSDIVFGNYWIFAAVGLMAMSYGGIEPYGETIGMVLHRGRQDYKPRKGYFGLAFKGAQWFCVCAGFLGVALAAMTGEVYKWYDIVVFCALLPILQEGGYRIFNQPYDKENKKYPRIFFSLTRREEWGRNVAVMLAILLLAAIRGDSFTLLMLFGGFVSGGIGWLIAMWFYVLSVYPLKSGKYLLGSLAKKHCVDGWKTMEFTLGAVGGLGVALTCVAGKDKLAASVEVIAANDGFWEPLPWLRNVSPFIVGALILAVIGINLYQFISESKGKKVSGYRCDLIERPLFNVVPMCLVLLGDLFTARIMTFFMLFFACAVKCAFDRFKNFKALPLWQVLIALSCAVVFAGDVILGGYSAAQVWFLAGAPYLLAEFMWVFSPGNIKKMKAGKSEKPSLVELIGGGVTVFPFFILQITALYVIGWQLFIN